jgi:hypothetical protein
MYCSKCGAWNPEDSRFCAKCGQRVEALAETPPAGKPSSRVLWIAAFFLLAALLCVTAFALRGRLSNAWQSLMASPTKIAPAPTTAATKVPTPVAATATAEPTVEPSPLPTATETFTPLPQVSPTPPPKPTPLSRTFTLVYKECIPHGFGLGSVKGQVFDKNGKVIQGAKVRITINGYEWQSDANPATSNQDGWYEWTLEVGQKVQFVELFVGGKSVAFSSKGFEVEARGGCYQRVDFVEQ